jgi:hypothetical protein
MYFTGRILRSNHISSFLINVPHKCHVGNEGNKKSPERLLSGLLAERVGFEPTIEEYPILT